MEPRSTVNISLNTDDRLDITKCNYLETQETKSGSFQIKLNLRAIVANIALHCLELFATDNCSLR